MRPIETGVMCAWLREDKERRNDGAIIGWKSRKMVEADRCDGVGAERRDGVRREVLQQLRAADMSEAVHQPLRWRTGDERLEGRSRKVHTGGGGDSSRLAIVRSEIISPK
eukprot:15964747-Heterocapsa_arctica.AAC.1